MRTDFARSVVLFGAGSPLIVDVEETCLRRGLEVHAIVNNVDGECYAIHADRIVSLAAVTATILEFALSIPLFTPGYRFRVSEQVRGLGGRVFTSLIDPTAIVPRSLECGEGVYVNCGVTLGGMASLGRFVLINRGASLGHHFTADEFASIGPGVVAGGMVTIGRGAVVGTGATLLPGVRIGANAVVGGGAVVTQDVEDYCLVVGNPARVVKRGILGYNGVGV